MSPSCPKLCECGCGNPAPIAKQNRRNLGHVKGEPIRFIRGHTMPHTLESMFARTEPVDMGYDSPCRVWKGVVGPSGYGLLKHKGARVPAHRLSYELAKGRIPDGLQIDHLCRTRACVNPDHLEAVEQKINLRRGINVKLNDAVVAMIRASEDTQVTLAARYGVHPAHISKIRSGRRWA